MTYGTIQVLKSEHNPFTTSKQTTSNSTTAQEPVDHCTIALLLQKADNRAFNGFPER